MQVQFGDGPSRSPSPANARRTSSTSSRVPPQRSRVLQEHRGFDQRGSPGWNLTRGRPAGTSPASRRRPSRARKAATAAGSFKEAAGFLPGASTRSRNRHPRSHGPSGDRSSDTRLVRSSRNISLTATSWFGWRSAIFEPSRLDGALVLKDQQLSAEASDNHAVRRRMWTDADGRRTHDELQKRAVQRPVYIASHRRGRWFDPSIAHQQRPGQSLRMGFRPGFFLMFGKGLSNAPKAVMHGRQPALAPRSYPVSTTFPSTARDSSRACAAAASDRGNVESTGTTNRRCATPASRACRSGRGS